MPRPTTAAAKAAKNLEASPDPWLRLYEFQVPTTPETRFRLTPHPTPVTWRGNVYSPAAIEHDEVEEDAEGTYGDMVLAIPNVNRDAAAYLEQYDLSGQPARFILVPAADLDSGQAVMDEDYRILSIDFDEKAVVLRLGNWSAYQATVPGTRAMRRHCRFQYRGARCAYLGALATCDKTLDGPNGCVAHGVDSADHPKRFGGFPLIRRESGIGSAA